MSYELEHIGSRLQVARHVIAKTRPDMAESLEVSAVTYANYERGHQNLIGRLEELAGACCTSTNFLTRGPLKLIPASGLSYRRKMSLKSAQARHIQGMASMACEFRAIIEEYVQLPAPRLPYAPVQSESDIEHVVAEIRSQLGMSDAPLRSAIALAESFGVLVFWVEGDSAFDGVSFWSEGCPYILLNKNQHDGYRARFTVLHELCHLICHKAPEAAERHEDERKRLDKEADLFASAFLLPASSFAKRFPRFGTLIDILDDRRYWMASCAAMVRRAWQLRLIDEDKYRKLNVGISAKGWRRGEPNSPLPEKSRIHQFFLDEAGEAGHGTSWLADRIACPIGWFREAFPQSEQYQNSFTFDGL